MEELGAGGRPDAGGDQLLDRAQPRRGPDRRAAHPRGARPRSGWRPIAARSTSSRRRVSVRHDWALTLETAARPGRGRRVDGRRDARRLAARRAPGPRARDGRRARPRRPAGARSATRGTRRELGAPGAAPGRRAGSRPSTPAAMRLSFPCRLRIRLRSGRLLEIEGEQRGVVRPPARPSSGRWWRRSAAS